MHVRADVQCSECHGDVASMEHVVRVNTLNMGWCMTCHRERSASIECVTCHK
ncbi:MAG: hypothetical protein GXP55_19740 [Deltaproteobacteria bacterium]|nr:hypothetical protein [Deltaproteobacteria bacterium]